MILNFRTGKNYELDQKIFNKMNINKRICAICNCNKKIRIKFFPKFVNKMIIYKMKSYFLYKMIKIIS